MTADALAQWRVVRERVDWASAGPAHVAPVVPRRDGLVSWIDGPVRSRDPERADRLLAATALSRAQALLRRPLTPALLTGWQRRVLGTSDVAFREGDAFAKRGRERYGLTAATWQDFARCLEQSSDPALPLASRAARAYLDVAFFHPFPDGNARSALLTLSYVLDVEGVRLDLVEPLQTTRYADDAAGAADLARLVDVLVRAARRRATASGPCAGP
ncbi:Fic family protein [Kitasatospora sp. NPDC001660]